MFDNKLLLASAQAVTASAISDEVIDLDTSNSAVAEGRPLYVYAYLTTAFDATTCTLTIDLYEGSTATIDTKVQELLPEVDGNNAPLDATGRILKAPLPIGEITERYIGLYFTVGGASTLSTGTIDAYLAP